MTRLTQLQQAEQQLIQAQLASDVDTLAYLLADELIFVGPDGHRYTKEMDLASHRTGQVRLTALTAQEPLIEWNEALAVVSVVVDLQGFFADQPIGGQFRYLRVWSYRQGRWQAVAGSCTPVSN